MKPNNSNNWIISCRNVVMADIINLIRKYEVMQMKLFVQHEFHLLVGNTLGIVQNAFFLGMSGMDGILSYNCLQH
jgi:hypothetical protein